jgi:hypothetical protein
VLEPKIYIDCSLCWTTFSFPGGLPNIGAFLPTKSNFPTPALDAANQGYTGPAASSRADCDEVSLDAAVRGR